MSGYCGLDPDLFQTTIATVTRYANLGKTRLSTIAGGRVIWLFNSYLRQIVPLTNTTLSVTELKGIYESLHYIVGNFSGEDREVVYDSSMAVLTEVSSDIIRRLGTALLEEPPHWYILAKEEVENESFAFELLRHLLHSPVAYNYTANMLADIVVMMANDRDSWDDEAWLLTHIIAISSISTPRVKKWLEANYKPQRQFFSKIVRMATLLPAKSDGLPIEEIKSIGFLGAGKYGSVHSAEINGKPLAIKIVNDSTAVVEVSLLTSLRHPNIIKLEEWKLGVRSSTLVLEYGGSNLEDTPAEDYNLRDVMVGCLEALVYLHTIAYVIHNDIKPANILIDRQGTPRLIDFGLSITGWLPGKDIELRTFRGTPAYAPLTVVIELADGFDEVEYGCRIDVYSMGIVFVEMMSGMKNFVDGTVESLDGLVALLEDRLGTLRNYKTDYPSFVDGMLRHQERERLTAAEALELLLAT